MNLRFLIPRLPNTLVTLVILSLPLIRERAVLPEGGYVVATYRPVVMLYSYLRLRDFYPFFLMFCFSMIVYLAVSAILAFTPSPFRKK